MQTKKNNDKLKTKSLNKTSSKKGIKLQKKIGGAQIFGALAPRSVKKGIRDLTTGSCDIGLKMGLVGSRGTYNKKKLRSVLENHRFFAGETDDFKIFFSENLLNLCDNESQMMNDSNSNSNSESKTRYNKIKNSLSYNPQSYMRLCVTIMECLKNDNFVKMLYDINRSKHGWTKTKKIGKIIKDEKYIQKKGSEEEKKLSRSSKIMEKKIAVMIFLNNIVIPIIKKYIDYNSTSNLKTKKPEPLLISRLNRTLSFLFNNEKIDILLDTKYFGELNEEWFKLKEGNLNESNPELEIVEHPLFKKISQRKLIDKEYDKKLEEDDKLSKGIDPNMMPEWASKLEMDSSSKSVSSKRCAPDDLLCKEKTERKQSGGYLIYIMLALVGFSFAFEYSSGSGATIGDNSKSGKNFGSLFYKV